MVRVEIRLVNGSMHEWEEDNDDLINEYYRLVKLGYKGKSLFNALLGDDWGPPPRGALFTGVLSNGMTVNESISYE